MSEYDSSSEFPDVEFILQWGADSQHGLCCGIFGCTGTVVIRCEICNGGYCNEHKEWHMHSDKFNGVIIKNEKKHALDITTKGWSKEEIYDLNRVVNEKNYKWEAKAINKRGDIKWFHAYTKIDVEIFAIQEGYKILKVTRKN